ncbi:MULTISPECIES: hypothetical protein [unclassified Rhizobium]|uniref:hypothetical protein n=1 Tax=unclassified Rhizobium TaxID=2613769 RepID=UPI0016759795|nr:MULTISPECIES: hypothetical protein [unclassified Rhizobium]
MSIEPIGIFTLALGLVGLALGYTSTAAIFVVLTIFGSAAAVLAGSANVQPAHLFLLFLAVATLAKRRRCEIVVRMLGFGKAGFWLACLVVYGAATAYFLPRLLAGQSLIIPLGVSEYPSTRGAVPLGPVSSNFTQTIYLIADLLCFLMIASVGSTQTGFNALVNGLIAYAAFNVLFALLDLTTSATGTQALLQFMRNAQYTFHENETINGMKRIVGSFPEASAFAGTSLGALGFTGTLWLSSRKAAWTGPISLATFLLIVLSTSTTGLVATPVCLVILYWTAVFRCGVTQASRNATAFVLIAPAIMVVITLFVILHKELYQDIRDYVDVLVVNKATSTSAAERGSWNTYGLQNFWDSSGLGVGLGTARTSSFPIAVLSNIGVPGALFFLLFMVSVLIRLPGNARTFASDVRLAARNGCLCLFVGACVAGPTVDLGLQFFILAGLASCNPAKVRLPAPVLSLRGGSAKRAGLKNMLGPLPPTASPQTGAPIDHP